MWQIACYPGMPDEAVSKYKAIQDAEKRQARTEKAMDIVARMKEA